MKILIENIEENKIYSPVLVEEVKWTTDFAKVPGQLEFNVLKDEIINFQEGNRIEFYFGEYPVFSGFIFKKSRDKSNVINVTAFDQLRYFKNKDTYIYENITASELLKKICEDFGLFCGNVENTSYIIPPRIEDNTTLFDIINNALDLTLINTKEMFVLFDDFGKISLKKISNMRLKAHKIDSSKFQDFKTETSIDNSYNSIKLFYKDAESGISNVFLSQDNKNVKKWGKLQYFDTIQNADNGQIMADSLLKLHNVKTRTLSLNGVFGLQEVRAGSIIPVSVDLGDIFVDKFFIVEKCTHHFKLNEHFMDLELKGE